MIPQLEGGPVHRLLRYPTAAQQAVPRRGSPVRMQGGGGGRAFLAVGKIVYSCSDPECRSRSVGAPDRRRAARSAAIPAMAERVRRTARTHIACLRKGEGAGW